MTDISKHIPSSCHVQSHLQNYVTIGIPTEIIVNGNVLFKRITIKDSTWNLSIRGKDINLKDIGVDSTFINTEECLRKTFEILNKIKVCTGVTITDVDHLYIDINKKTVIKEFISISGNENTSVTKLRYVNCDQTLKWGSSTEACRTCQKKITINKELQSICDESLDDEVNEDNDGDSIPLSKKDQKDLTEIFESVFPGASTEMKTLLQSQAQALKCKNRKSIRWDKTILSLCLSMWIRSPANYQQLRESNFLILPSGRQLRKYKNEVPQKSGINDEILHWMY